MPFRNITVLTEQGWTTVRRAVRPPGEKPLMTDAELDKFQQNFLYEWEVRKMSKRARLTEGQTEVEPQEAEEPEPMNARPPVIPPPAHLLKEHVSARQGNYYTRPDDQ